MVTLGLDSGSATTKAAVFDGEKIQKIYLEKTSDRPGKVIRDMYSQLYSQEIAMTVTTGYGRGLLEQADRKITEITCHGAGAAYLMPQCSAVIDIGGQDCKVMLLDEHGKVTDFLMNDKCAAVTGRFIDMTLGRVGAKVEELDEFVRGATPEKINSMCAVFAESEIVGLLAQEKKAGDILLGCLHSICKRTAIFAQKLIREEQEVFFSGGLAQAEVIRSILESYMKPAHIVTHELAQYTGAIGAAVLGYEKAGGKKTWN